LLLLLPLPGAKGPVGHRLVVEVVRVFEGAGEHLVFGAVGIFHLLRHSRVVRVLVHSELVVLNVLFRLSLASRLKRLLGQVNHRKSFLGLRDAPGANLLVNGGVVDQCGGHLLVLFFFVHEARLVGLGTLWGSEGVVGAGEGCSLAHARRAVVFP